MFNDVGEHREWLVQLAGVQLSVQKPERKMMRLREANTAAVSSKEIVTGLRGEVAGAFGADHTPFSPVRDCESSLTHDGPGGIQGPYSSADVVGRRPKNALIRRA